MKIYESILELAGNTPLVSLSRLCAENGCCANILAKIESRNPAGSVKDRVGIAMIEAAEREGLLPPGGTIIEPTSGNTGIGLALAARLKGYRVILTMPDSMSIERRRLLAAYGAELVLTDGALGMSGAIARAKELCAQTPGAYIPGQFENPANPQAHYDTTGPEIWRDTDGEVAMLIAGVGTGGTLTGAGRFLKEQRPDIIIAAAEPAESAVLSGGAAGVHGIQGIGAGFIPATADTALYDEIFAVPTEAAMQTCRKIAAAEGILCGISGGAAVWAALQAAKRESLAGKNIVVILPDSGERYMSGGLFDE